MPKKGKGKKDKKDKGGILTAVTTIEILKEREKVLCPRLGDSYTLHDNVTKILESSARQVLEKAVSRQYSNVNLSCYKLYQLDIPNATIKGLQSLTNLNLSI